MEWVEQWMSTRILLIKMIPLAEEDVRQEIHKEEDVQTKAVTKNRKKTWQWNIILEDGTSGVDKVREVRKVVWRALRIKSC